MCIRSPVAGRVVSRMVGMLVCRFVLDTLRFLFGLFCSSRTGSCIPLPDQHLPCYREVTSHPTEKDRKLYSLPATCGFPLRHGAFWFTSSLEKPGSCFLLPQ